MIAIRSKSGGFISAPLHKLKSPRSILAFVLECLSRRCVRLELIEAIKMLERRNGIELGGLTTMPTKQHKLKSREVPV